MLVEDVDFTRAIPIEFVARKSLVANLSDLAAMGATPAYAVVALGAPPYLDIEGFMSAMAAAAAAYKIEIVGGDLSRAEKIIVSITAVGRAKHPLLRSGARPGDRIYVSRPLGASRAGLELLKRGWSLEPPPDLPYGQREFVAAVIRRHVDPEPEVALGIALLVYVVWSNWAPDSGQGLAHIWQKHIVEGEPIHAGYFVLAAAIGASAAVSLPASLAASLTRFCAAASGAPAGFSAAALASASANFLA